MDKSMKLYITAMSLFVLAVFYLPLVFWILKRIWQSSRWHGLKKAGMLMMATVLAYAIPLGDVTVNSLAMAKVCPTAGLHIYKTVEVEGYLANIGDSSVLRKYPYRFIEAKTYQTKPDGSRYYIKYEMQPDGTIKNELIAQPTATYEVLSEQWHLDQKLGVSVTRDVVRNRISGEVLADIKLFNPIPGWVDKVLVYRWFGLGGQHGCWGQPASFVYVNNILIPKSDLLY